MEKTQAKCESCGAIEDKFWMHKVFTGGCDTHGSVWYCSKCSHRMRTMAAYGTPYKMIIQAVEREKGRQ